MLLSNDVLYNMIIAELRLKLYRSVNDPMWWCQHERAGDLHVPGVDIIKKRMGWI